MELIKQIDFKCEDIELSPIRGSKYPIFEVKALDVDSESLMENLNFEDVMNYYGVSKVCEWCEANR